MRRLLIAICLLASSQIALAQGWESIGEFSNPPSVVWYDSLFDRIYVAGNYSWFDSTEVHGFGYISGDTIIGLGCGFSVDCGVPLPYGASTTEVKDFAWYKGELFACGFFNKAGGNTAFGIAKWDGSDWTSIGKGLTYKGSSSNGQGFGFEVMMDELYLYGIFDSINDIEAHGIAKFDGSNWSSVFDLPHFSTSITTPNLVVDAEWFHGELYVGGNFSLGGSDPPITDIVKWNGTAWVAVGNGITGGFNSITRITTFNGKLIIAGGFDKVLNPGSIPGNNITSWDGVQWDTLSGGVWGVPFSAAMVQDIQIHNNEMYVFGTFKYAGGMPASMVAKWDGTKWCSNAVSYGPQGPVSGAFFHDTLFIVGSIWQINGDSSLKYLVKWPDVSTFGDSCTAVNLDDPIDLSEIQIFPNPARDEFSIKLPDDIPECSINIFDITGRQLDEIKKYSKTNPIIQVNHLPDGMYFVQVAGAGWRQTLKLVKQ